MISLLLAAALAALSAAPSPAPADIVVQSSAARPAIERILRADNLDVDNLPAREVADTMADIPRGVAPLDFWQAYREHVRAWQDENESAAADEMDDLDAVSGSEGG